jgi:hypothetical protein
MSSELKANKISPATSTDITLGDSGDTFTVPSGATLAVSGTMTLPANSVDSDQYVDGSIDNAHLADDAVDSDELAAGSVDIAHLSATGTAGSGNFLRGDNSWTAVTPAAITSYTNSTNNRVLTSVDSSTVNAEANLSFDGTSLDITGNVSASGNIYAGDGTSSLPSLSFGGETDLGIYRPAAQTISICNSTARVIDLFNDNRLFIYETANANQTFAMTINQSTYDDEIFALKSSDVAHGCTSVAETDTNALFMKSGAVSGGLCIKSVQEAGTHVASLVLESVGGDTGATSGKNKTSVASGKVEARVAGISGTGLADVDANYNVFNIKGYTSSAYRTLFIVDLDGDYHYDGSDAGAFDAYDDGALLRATQIEISTPSQIIRNKFDDWVSYNRKDLVDAKLLGKVTPEEWDEGVRPLVNGAQMQRLQTGAIVQQRAMFETLKEVVEEMLPGFSEKLNERLEAQSLPALPGERRI